MTISTIIFDCDGVLVDSEIIAVAVEMEHLARIGLHYEKSDFQRRFIGLTDVDFFNALERDYLALDAGEIGRAHV